jgi:CRP/FNR family transcriptional regulator, cyclic AMP receptor protein
MHGYVAILIETMGYLGALFTFAAYSSKSMVRLRIAGILANVAFIGYGAAAAVYPTLLLHAVLLPMNVVRLRQMRRLVRQVAEAARGDLSIDWLRPFTHRRRFEAGQRLWQRGDAATEMLFVLGGRFKAVEADVALGPGDVIGEIGLVDADQRRTQSVECVEAGEALTITYDEVRQLAFQNAKFGFYFLQLVSRRLLRDVRRLEAAAPSVAG